MADTTTVRVSTRTRDRLRAKSDAAQVSADVLIARGLELIEREEWRRQAELDARRAAADPADRAEVAAALADLTGS